MKKHLVTFLCIIGSITLIKAQSEDPKSRLEFYGKFSVHTAIFDNQIELQENLPKLGLQLDHKVNEDLSFIVNLEYRYHIIDGEVFNNDAASPDEFISDPFKEIQPFEQRLMYGGFSYGKWGTLTVGKQWGVYYDIAGYTDNFTVFGGSATGVYSGGTDGGWKGTGRADKSIVYRNSFGNLDIGLQTQLFGKYENYGISAEYALNSWRFGIAYNTAKIQDEAKEFIEDIGNTTDNYVAGLHYNHKDVMVTAAVTFNDDEFIRIGENEIISFATMGYELFSSFRPFENIEIQAGVNYMDDVDSNDHDLGQYHLLQWIGGLNYYFQDNLYIHSSFRLDGSKSVTGARGADVFLVGFTYNFSKVFSK